MGTSVSEVFGQDLGDYEWKITIKKEDIHLLIKALIGKHDDNILELIKEKCTGENSLDLEKIIYDNDIPCKIWSWNSD